MDQPIEKFNTYVRMSDTYKGYDIFKSISLVFISYFVLYNLLILIPNPYITVPFFFIGSITLFIILGSAIKNTPKYITNPAVKRDIRILTILQLMFIVYDTVLTVILFVFKYSNIVPPTMTLQFTKFVYYFFEIMYYLRYIFIFFGFITLNTIHQQLVKNISYKNRRLIAGYFALPLIILKFIFYQSDLILFSEIFWQSSWGAIPLYHLAFTGSLVVHLILIAVYVGFVIETSIKQRIISLIIIDNSKENT